MKHVYIFIEGEQKEIRKRRRNRIQEEEEGEEDEPPEEERRKSQKQKQNKNHNNTNNNNNNNNNSNSNSNIGRGQNKKKMSKTKIIQKSLEFIAPWKLQTKDIESISIRQKSREKKTIEQQGKQIVQKLLKKYNLEKKKRDMEEEKMRKKVWVEEEEMEKEEEKEEGREQQKQQKQEKEDPEGTRKEQKEEKEEKHKEMKQKEGISMAIRRSMMKHQLGRHLLNKMGWTSEEEEEEDSRVGKKQQGTETNQNYTSSCTSHTNSNSESNTSSTASDLSETIHTMSEEEDMGNNVTKRFLLSLVFIGTRAKESREWVKEIMKEPKIQNNYHIGGFYHVQGGEHQEENRGYEACLLKPFSIKTIVALKKGNDKQQRMIRTRGFGEEQPKRTATPPLYIQKRLQEKQQHMNMGMEEDTLSMELSSESIEDPLSADASPPTALHTKHENLTIRHFQKHLTPDHTSSPFSIMLDTMPLGNEEKKRFQFRKRSVQLQDLLYELWYGASPKGLYQEEVVHQEDVSPYLGQAISWRHIHIATEQQKTDDMLKDPSVVQLLVNMMIRDHQNLQTHFQT